MAEQGNMAEIATPSPILKNFSLIPVTC